MANYVYGQYYFSGPADVLEKFKSALDYRPELQEPRKGIREVMDAFGISSEDYAGDIREVLTDPPRFDEKSGRLYITTEAAWWTKQDFWDVVSDRLGLKYASMTDGDGEPVIHNDPDGLVFPYDVMVDVFEPEGYFDDYFYEFFKDEDEAVEYFEKHNVGAVVKTGTRPSFKEWKAFVEDNGIGSVYEIIKDGDPVFAAEEDADIEPEV